MDAIRKHIILHTTNLEIGYASKKKKLIITSNINIEVKKGTFVCLLGKNGIGKSTLLRTLSKVQKPLSGKVFILDKNINAIPLSDFSKTVSLVLTEKLPESNLTVFELIALGRQPYTNWIGNLTKIDIEKIKESMRLTKIDHLANNKYFELSDGQLQKVMISRALAQDTDLIILDEPTAHLDVQHKMETFKLLKELTEKHHKTIIISTHEIHSALQSSHELWLMTDDDFISGSTHKLIENLSIEKLFNSKDITFDSKQQQFKLKSDS